MQRKLSDVLGAEVPTIMPLNRVFRFPTELFPAVERTTVEKRNKTVLLVCGESRPGEYEGKHQ